MENVKENEEKCHREGGKCPKTRNMRNKREKMGRNKLEPPSLIFFPFYFWETTEIFLGGLPKWKFDREKAKITPGKNREISLCPRKKKKKNYVTVTNYFKKVYQKQRKKAYRQGHPRS